MSLDATRWVWSLDRTIVTSIEKLILLSLADRADENFECFPSSKRLCEDTNTAPKTIKKYLKDLRDKGLIIKTGQMKGRTNSVPVYKLIGPSRREDEVNVTQLKNEAGVKRDHLSRGKVTPLNLSVRTYKNTYPPTPPSKGGESKQVGGFSYQTLLEIYAKVYPEKPNIPIATNRLERCWKEFSKSWPLIAKKRPNLTLDVFEEFLISVRIKSPGWALNSYINHIGSEIVNDLFVFINPDNVMKFFKGEFK